MIKFIKNFKYNLSINFMFSETNQQIHDIVKKKVKIQSKKPLIFTIINSYKSARASTIQLPHATVYSPVYMPVGTKGTIKGLTSQQMQALGCKILLSNTYHLRYQPGEQLLKKVGGLHKFMNWNNNILTDSGGFQMVSLSKLCEITQEGVTFLSPVDKSEMFLRPEDSIVTQNCIGSDIMMALDDVVKTTTVGPRMQEAMHRTIRWIDRNMNANQNPQKQNLFPIVQGGINIELRRKCIEQLSKKDANGFAIGGLAGGQSKQDFIKVVKYCCDNLPKNKPRYLMGVGYPVDLVLCSSLGVDMFDCVFPTRTARFGTVFTAYGQISLKNKQFALDFRPIQQNCQCQTCKTYTKAYLHTIAKQDVCCHLLTTHNLYYELNLMTALRQSILDQTLDLFVKNFLQNIYSVEKRIPDWVKLALELANLQVQINFDK